LIAAEVVRENQIEGLSCLGFVLIVPAWIVPTTALLHLLGRQSEKEEVLLASLLGHLDSSPITSAHGQSAVHHEFHVAGATRFVAGRGNLLRYVTRRNQPLR